MIDDIEEVDVELERQRLDALALLACIKTAEDCTKLEDIGVSVDCFGAFDGKTGRMGEAYTHIANQAGKGKPASRLDVKRRFGITLNAEHRDIMHYAQSVVNDYRKRASGDAWDEFADEVEVKKGDITSALRVLKNNLNLITLNMNHKSGVLLGHDGWTEEPEAMEWIIEGILPAKWPTFFYGRGGVAKSYLLLYLALCVVNRKNFFTVPTKKRNVLYLDWEMDAEEFYYRAASIGRGLGVGKQRTGENGKTEWQFSGLYYYRVQGSLADNLTDVREMIADNKIGLVIVDSFGFSMGESQEMKESADTISYMRILSSLPCAVAIIDHVSKMKDSDGTPFGSVYKLNSCRWAWWVSGVSNPEDVERKGTYQKWVNTKHNMGPRHDDMFTRLNWDTDEDTRRVSFTADRINADQAPKELVGEQKTAKDAADNMGGCTYYCYTEIQEAGSKGISRQELITDSGYSYVAVDNATKSLIKKGLVTSHKEKYQGGEQPEKVFYIHREVETQEQAAFGDITESGDADI